MLHKILTWAILLMLSGHFACAAAQDHDDLNLAHKITSAIEQKEPTWKLSRKAVMPRQLLTRWVAGERVTVDLHSLASPEAASDLFTIEDE